MAPLIQPSLIKNKIKRQDVANKQKKEKGKQKLQKRLARAKQEANDPAAKKVCTNYHRLTAITHRNAGHFIQKRITENVPQTLDNTREHDPSMLPTSKQPSASIRAEELNADLASDPFATYFNFTDDPHTPPKVLITTSPKASKATYDFCDELVGVFPGAEYVRRKKGKGFEVGRIAGWAAGRGYKHLVIVNDDMKKPSECSPCYTGTCIDGALPQMPLHWFIYPADQRRISGSHLWNLQNKYMLVSPCSYSSHNPF